MADDDLREILDYLSDRSATAAVRFREACFALMDDLAGMPGRGPVVTVTPAGTLRRVIVPGFGNYLLFYYTTDEQVIVARVLHSSRDTANDLKSPGDA